MKEKKFAVIGHPLSHTMSPFIHKNLMEISGVSGTYCVYDILPQNLNNKYKEILCKLDGFNITIPYKTNIIDCIDTLDSKSTLYRSVNTVHIKNNVSKGYTTDPVGFTKALHAENIPLSGNVVILGCGGVARTFVYEALLKNCSVTFAIRKDDEEACKQLMSDITTNFIDSHIYYVFINDLINYQKNIDLLINATPVGMFPNIEQMPVDESVVLKSSAVFDAVYNPLKTKLIITAEKNKVKALGGLSMLVWQAAEAQKIWTGYEFSAEEINKICALTEKELLK